MFSKSIPSTVHPLILGKFWNDSFLRCTKSGGSWLELHFCRICPKTVEIFRWWAKLSAVMIWPHSVLIEPSVSFNVQMGPFSTPTSEPHGPCLWFYFGTNHGPVQSSFGWILILKNWVTTIQASQSSVPIRKKVIKGKKMTKTEKWKEFKSAVGHLKVLMP